MEDEMMTLPTDDDLRELIADGHVVRGLTIYQCDDLAQAYLDQGAEIARLRAALLIIASGNIPGISTKVMHKDWLGIFTDCQDIANAALGMK